MEEWLQSMELSDMELSDMMKYNTDLFTAKNQKLKK